MSEIDLDRIVPFREAIRLTGYYETKFYHPRVREILEANGAVYHEKPESKPALSTFPMRALIAAGLIDENGNSTKKPRKPRESSAANRQYYSRLPYAAVELEIDRLNEQLEGVRESQSPAQAELEASELALEEARARREAAAKEVTRLQGAERALSSNIEYLNARGYDLRAQLANEAAEARRIADEKAAEAAAAEAKYGTASSKRSTKSESKSKKTKK